MNQNYSKTQCQPNWSQTATRKRSQLGWLRLQNSRFFSKSLVARREAQKVWIHSQFSHSLQTFRSKTARICLTANAKNTTVLQSTDDSARGFHYRLLSNLTYLYGNINLDPRAFSFYSVGVSFWCFSKCACSFDLNRHTGEWGPVSRATRYGRVKNQMLNKKFVIRTLMYRVLGWCLVLAVFSIFSFVIFLSFCIRLHFFLSLTLADFIEPKYNYPPHRSPRIPAIANKHHFGAVLKPSPFGWHVPVGWFQFPLVRTKGLEDFIKGLVPVLWQRRVVIKPWCHSQFWRIPVEFNFLSK